MHLVLRHQFVCKDGSFYSAEGIATGMSAGVNLAQIYLADLDEIPAAIARFYCRFIDDTLLIGPASTTAIAQRQMNDWSKIIWELEHTGVTDVPYLDLSLTIDHIHNRISYKTFRKPLNSYAFPTADSMHGKHLAKSIVTSETHRYISTNDKSSNVWMQCEFLLEKLANRGYDRGKLRQIARAVILTASAPRQRTPVPAKRFLTLTRSSSTNTREVKRVLRRYHHLLPGSLRIGICERLQRSWFRRLYKANFNPLG